MAVRISFIMALVFAFGFNLNAGQCFKGCPREVVEEGPVLDEALKTLIAQSEMIFVGTVSGVEPAVPAYPEGGKADWDAYDKLSDEFKATNVVTFAVDSVWKGEKVDTIKLRGGNLLLIYQNTKKFLVFVSEGENTRGLRFDINKSIFGFVDVNHPDYHWNVDLGKPGVLATTWLPTESFRSNKRLPADYGPYVRKWDGNQHLWRRGDTAYWTPGLKKATAARLAGLDPRFKNSRRSEEVFSLTTRGCQFIRDEFDRRGGSGFIGWQPCPMPLSLLEAYVRVRAGK